jgi:hypothetical protein
MRKAGPKDPLHDVDWISGRAVEVFYADEKLAHEFGGSAGWYWWETETRSDHSRRATGPSVMRCRAVPDAGDVEQNRRGTPPAVLMFSRTRRLRRAARR